MRILENGIYRDATEKEIAEMQNGEMPPVENEITDAERIEALEAAVFELAGVIFNG